MGGDLFEQQSTLLPRCNVTHTGNRSFQVASGEEDISRVMDATSTTWLTPVILVGKLPCFGVGKFGSPFETFKLK